MAYALADQGDLRGSLDAYVNVADTELMRANSVADYQRIRGQAKSFVAPAQSLPDGYIALHAAIVAADASYWASTIETRDLSVRETWEDNALTDLADAIKIGVSDRYPDLNERLLRETPNKVGGGGGLATEAYLLTAACLEAV